MRAAARGVRLGAHIMLGLALAAVYPALSAPAQKSIMRRWSRTVLGILNVRLNVRGAEQVCGRQGGLLVANHISWLDVFAVGAVCPAAFVAKSEVRRWPLIGTLCIRTGTIFIARGNRRDTLRANREIGDRMGRGEWAALFPEGTSTDGADVGAFHGSLFQPAIDCGRAVVPVAVKYHDECGNAARDAAFIGDMTFVRSLLNVLYSDALHVSVVFLPPLDCAGKTRRRVADEARAAVRGVIVQQNDRGVGRA